MKDWTAEYDNRASVPEADEIIAGWATKSQQMREQIAGSASLSLDLSYGNGARNLMDLFLPAGNARGTVVFIHGGYWRMLDKSYFSFLAAGPLAKGWAVAMPSYSLAPQARIGEITLEIAAAIEKVAAMQSGPLRLIGHSAGGHLVARMMCSDAVLQETAFDRIENTVAVSGLFDLENLQHAAMNEDLQLEASEVARESPALLGPRGNARITCFVGSDEKPEFIRQNDLLEGWRNLGARVTTEIDPGKNHFTVINPLSDPDSHLVQCLFD